MGCVTYEKAFTERYVLDFMEFSQNCILVIKDVATVDARGYVIVCIDADFIRNLVKCDIAYICVGFCVVVL